MTDKSQDSLRDKIINGVAASIVVAIEQARQTGTSLVVWRDGKIVEISPEEADRERASHERGVNNG